MASKTFVSLGLMALFLSVGSAQFLSLASFVTPNCTGLVVLTNIITSCMKANSTLSALSTFNETHATVAEFGSGDCTGPILTTFYAPLGGCIPDPTHPGMYVIVGVAKTAQTLPTTSVIAAVSVGSCDSHAEPQEFDAYTPMCLPYPLNGTIYGMIQTCNGTHITSSLFTAPDCSGPLADIPDNVEIDPLGCQEQNGIAVTTTCSNVLPAPVSSNSSTLPTATPTTSSPTSTPTSTPSTSKSTASTYPPTLAPTPAPSSNSTHDEHSTSDSHALAPFVALFVLVGAVTVF